ncbi:UNVERIFIED_CONTAM: hypothetical protein PYX00_000506 [Menopon gallinae]|uniref:Anoctamin n=1 Tax=Menopon gallinae TaxID=328185 RepID=A0AAW2IAH7_9NEOP
MEEVEKETGTDDVQLRQRKIITSAKMKLDSASKLLRKKIPCTGLLMTPRKLWIQMIPTRECDVVVMFPSGISDSILMWLLSRLKEGAPGLVVHVRHHSSSDNYGFYLTAPYKVLLKTAEECHLPKTLKKEYGGGLKEFVEKELNRFDGAHDENGFFTTQERQWLVLNLLQNLRASANDVTEKPAGVVLNEGQAIVPKFLTAGIISQVFPLHDLPSLEKLQKSWVQAIFEKQPLDEICDYFGVKIAMYFAWLGHYTTALIVPAAIGFLFWIGFCRGDQATEDIGFVLFSIFNVLWTSVYLEAWKRLSATLAYKWGTLDQRGDLLVEPRPLFVGQLEVSPVTNRLEPTYPAWKRYVFRYCVSVPVIALCLAIVFVTMIVILQLQDWWDNVLQKKGYPFFLSYFPKILLAIVITFFDEAYYKVAYWLNDKENYRVDTKFENHLIVKVALFQFVNSFLSLFYIAFYLQDQEKLKEQLAALLITRQIIGNIKESALPYVLEQIRLAKLSFDLFGALSPSKAKEPPGVKKDDAEEEEEEERKAEHSKAPGNRNIGQAELESNLFKYDGTFEDHLEIFIQMGYVVLFSSAFPMAAFCALVNNLIEIRSDAFKLCFIFQRPFGQRVANIGSWQNAMELMGIIAVLVNCALIGLSGQVHRMFPEMSTTQTILLIVALEHIVLIVRFLISYSIPDLPEWVATEMAKVEFARREAVRRFSTTSTQELISTGLVIGRFVVSPASEDSDHPETFTDSTDNAGESTRTRKESSSTSQSAAGSKASIISNDGGASKSHPQTPDTLIKPIVKTSHDWPTAEESTHHLTIGPHPSTDWIRRLALEKTRKTSEPEVGAKSKEGLSSYRSTDCIPKDSSSSDSDLLRSAPPWSRSRFRFSPEKETKSETLPVPSMEAKSLTVSESSMSIAPEASNSAASGSAPSKTADPAELAAKKQRIKQSLMKRARSVAIFSLKLKERRAREGKLPETPKPKEQPKPVWGTKNEGPVGGELGCIPLEMLISIDDVAKDLQRRQNPST